SLNSEERNYEYFCGRRYHAYGPMYLRPNDVEELDTEDLLHHTLLLLLDQRLYLAPLKHTPKKILDLGTGTGIWSIDVVDKLCAETSVTGCDISPVQPCWVPPNLTFYVENIFLMGGPFDWDATPKYDLVHCRNLCTAVKDWPALINGAYRSLRSGGFLEVQELIPLPFAEESAQDSQMAELLSDAYTACGIDLV
ncbi:S-adenosyl-L-methionine-dependent methyltransferase, partial [Glonium stellatum]